MPNLHSETFYVKSSKTSQLSFLLRQKWEATAASCCLKTTEDEEEVTEANVSQSAKESSVDASFYEQFYQTLKHFHTESVTPRRIVAHYGGVVELELLLPGSPGYHLA